MHTDVAIPEDRNVLQKGSGKEVKIQEFMYRDATNVEPEMYGCTGNNWSHWNSNEKLKEKFGSCTGKKNSIDSLQRTAILGTSHIIRKVLQCEAWSLSGGDHCWFKRSTGKKCLWQETIIQKTTIRTDIKFNVLTCHSHRHWILRDSLRNYISTYQYFNTY